jgi:hypothetical protein
LQVGFHLLVVTGSYANRIALFILGTFWYAGRTAGSFFFLAAILFRFDVIAVTLTATPARVWRKRFSPAKLRRWRFYGATATSKRNKFISFVIDLR